MTYYVVERVTDYPPETDYVDFDSAAAAAEYVDFLRRDLLRRGYRLVESDPLLGDRFEHPDGERRIIYVLEWR